MSYFSGKDDYFKENFRIFKALDFIAEVTAHIPPKNKQYIRRYGLYSSRTRGIWERSSFIVKLAPSVWKERHGKTTHEAKETVPETHESPVNNKEQNSTWVRLIKKVYGTDPLVCPKCGSPMEIIAVIMEPSETSRILKHLVKVGRPPPNFDPASLN